MLDLNLEPITTTAEPGESISFLKELSNLGSLKRYDVVIKQEIINPKTGKVIAQKTETRAIETFGSTQTKILVPKDAEPGDYLARVIVEYDNQKAVATLPVKIVSFAKKETNHLEGPKDIPELVGRYMVVEMKQDPNFIWTMKGVVRQINNKEYYCRVYDAGKTAQAGVQVKDWTSLDGPPELILWEGYFDKETNTARREKFVKPSSSSN